MQKKYIQEINTFLKEKKTFTQVLFRQEFNYTRV